MNLPPGQPPIDPRGTLRPPGAPAGMPPAGPGPVPPPAQQTFQGPRPPMPPGYGPPMPPMMPPPGFYPMPPRGGGGKGWIVALVAVLIGLGLIAGLFAVVVAVIGSGPTPGQSVRHVEQAGNAGETVAIIPVFGMILDDVEQQFADDMKAAEADADVKAVLVHIDSPGGTVTDSYQMYEALRLFRERTNKPVVVHMDSVAASGGYFLACAADEIVAEPTTITGSIGVLISYPQLSAFAEKTGIRFQTLVADGSPHKNALDMWTEPTPESLADIQALLNQQHDLFRQVVNAGRAEQLSKAGHTVADVATGKIWLGPEAQKLGLVDHVGLIDTAIARAAALAKLTRPNVVRFTREPTLAEALGLASAGQAAGATGTGMRLDARSLDSPELKRAAAKLLHELSAPRALYLYRGVQ